MVAGKYAAVKNWSELIYSTPGQLIGEGESEIRKLPAIAHRKDVQARKSRRIRHHHPPLVGCIEIIKYREKLLISFKRFILLIFLKPFGVLQLKNLQARICRLMPTSNRAEFFTRCGAGRLILLIFPSANLLPIFQITVTYPGYR